ncbi:MAG: S8 family serine peptidase [Anaerolineae bacterium]|nr:S8 family serine peptidase [Anaerolineae bacterium]
MRSRFSSISLIIALLALLAPAASAAVPTTPPVAATNETSAVYIIVFEAPSLPMYTGGVPGLPATNIQRTGAVKLNVHNPASVAYRTYLRNQQARFSDEMTKTLGRPVEVIGTYQLSLNGMAARLTPAEARIVERMAGVKTVTPDWFEHAQSDAGPGWVGAGPVWDGTATGDAGTMGEGIVIAIVDTGINMDHPSFADVGGDGYNHTNPRGKYYGWCDPDNPNYTDDALCNDKLIGLWSADEDLPEDYTGHGSHVASIAAGNVVSASVYALTTSITSNISGVAPHANIIGYSIEGEPGSAVASGTAIIAATEQLIEDGVDVVNCSFGGSGMHDPWVYAQQWLNVRAAGIFVAVSAGDYGTRAGVIGTPGTAPWVLSVSSATHNRAFPNSLIDLEGGAEPLDDIVGRGLSAGYGPAPIVSAAWYTDIFTQPVSGYSPEELASMCLIPFPEGTFDGEIVLCDRGEINRVQKGYNVLQGGAGGYVLANDEDSGAILENDSHYLPAVQITYEDSLALKSWLTNTVVQTATITGVTLDINDDNGDVMDPLSSKGSNVVADVLKPNVAAPGVEILAAVQTNQPHPTAYPEYGFYTGSSMASPHAAGVAALLRKVHPTWSPAQLQSALETTAVNAWGFYKADKVTHGDPFDVGAGRVYAATAVKAGLLLDESAENFAAANPFEGGDPADLNLPGLAQDKCVYDCSWTRVVQSSADTNETWMAAVTNPPGVELAVTPASFELAPGEVQTITITADVSNTVESEWLFGEVRFTPATSETVTAHFPVALKSEFSTIPELVKINTWDSVGVQTADGFEVAQPVSGPATHLYGLTQATLVNEYLNQNSTPGKFSRTHNPEAGVMVITTTITDTNKRLVAEVLYSHAPNVNLFIYREGETYPVCSSSGPGALEYCSYYYRPGVYYIVVENFEGSVGEPTSVVGLWDRVIVSYAVVGDPLGNMSINVPGSVPTGQEFSVDIEWDLTPEERPEDAHLIHFLHFYKFYGAFALGTNPSQPGNIGYPQVDVKLNLMWDVFLPVVLRNLGSTP